MGDLDKVYYKRHFFESEEQKEVIFVFTLFHIKGFK